MMVQRVKDYLERCEMIFGCVTKTKHSIRAATPMFSSSTTSVLATAVHVCEYDKFRMSKYSLY